MKYPLWGESEVFNGFGSLALQIDGWDLMYCNRVERSDKDLDEEDRNHPFAAGLSEGQHQTWINAIVEAPKAFELLQRLVDTQDIGTFYAICDEAREVLAHLDDFVADVERVS